MRKRRAVIIFIIGAVSFALLAGAMPRMVEDSISHKVPTETSSGVAISGSAVEVLETLEVKGRAPKAGYSRSQFGDGWAMVQGCSTRNIILNRDLTEVVIDEDCKIISGVLVDPYTSETIIFSKDRSADIQIDHVIALSDAWQKGAQALTADERKQLANDPLELLAVSGAQNQAKGDGDAATWLPKNKAFRCEYIARQIAVKAKYKLWVTEAERQAMKSVLSSCPAQELPH